MYKIIIRFLIFISPILFFTSVTFGTDYYVDCNTTNPPGSGTQSDPWVTISYALAQVSGLGDTIFVAPGVYSPEMGPIWNEIFPLYLKNGITIIGSGVNATTLNGKTKSTVIYSINNDSMNTVEGFTIKNGGPSNYRGGAFYVENSNIKINNNLITQNVRSSDEFGNRIFDGGGVYCTGSYCIIEENTISFNKADDGGGICLYSSDGIIKNNIILGNKSDGIYCSSSSPQIVFNIIKQDTCTSTRGGAGIYCDNNSNPYIYKNKIIENGGSAVFCYNGSSPTIERNIISGNWINWGEDGAVRCEGGYVSGQSSPSIINNTIAYNLTSGIVIDDAGGKQNKCQIIKNNIISYNRDYGIYETSELADPISVTYNIFYYNEKGLYYNEGSQIISNVTLMDNLITECSHNIESDPLFADTSNYEFILSQGSPCIDAGDPSSPLDPDDTYADIGAYYFDQGTEDYLGPITFNAVADPNPTGNAISITLTAFISDLGRKGNTISEAEYFVDVIGNHGSGSTMSAADGSFDSTIEEVTASIDVSSWSEGSTYNIYVHGKDFLNNWGDFDSVLVSISSQVNNSPNTPSLISPGQNAFLDNNTPTLTWNIPVDVDGDQLHFKVEIDEDGTFGYGVDYAFESRDNATGFNPSMPTPQGTSTASYTLQSLLDMGTWWWRICAWDGTVYGNTSDSWNFFICGEPTVMTESATSIGPNTVTLNGSVNPNGLSTTIQFRYVEASKDWWLNSRYVTAMQSPISDTSYISVSAVLTNLSPNTTYKYYVVGENSLGKTYGNEISFTTTQTVTELVAVTGSASSISTNSATLNGLINPNGLSSTVKFEYGTTTSYGNEVTATQSPVSGTSSVAVSAPVTGLSSNTAYHFRIEATNSSGTTYGDDQSFTTLQSGSAATVTSNSATDVSATSSTLNGSVNPNGLSTTVKFEYGTTTSYGSEVTATESPLSGTSSQSVSAPVTDLSSNTTYHYRVVATNSAGTTYGNDRSFTTLHSSDSQAPSITHSAISNAQYNQSMTITATITDNISISSVQLYYRKGGSNTFTSVDMSNISGDTYQCNIPSSIVTERGLEYYIEAKDNSYNTSYNPSINPTISPHVILVTFYELACPNSTPSNSYRMISVPLNLNLKTPGSILEDDFGSYDDTKWRLIRWQSGEYKEYAVNTIESFNPGNAFWLITKDSDSWDVDSGQSVTTVNNYSITLQSGWNQIGNPFAFAVNWDDVIKNGNMETPVGYEGSGNETAGYQYNQIQLVPWKGYYIRNLESNSITIEIPPVAASGVTKSMQNPILLADETGEWVIQIRAVCEDLKDTDNYLGCLKDSQDGWDQNDFSEAPPIGEYISLYFPHTEWNLFPGNYTGDFRCASWDKQVWIFDVITNITDSKVTLKFSEFDKFPVENELILIDKFVNAKINLKEINLYDYVSYGESSKRQFVIIYGANDFINENLDNLSKIPQTYQLLQNSPNPFNSSTVIQYQLPEGLKVTLYIYNNIGIRIRTLFNNTYMQKGCHFITWDGKDDQHNEVGSGIYFCNLITDKYTKSIKILLVR